MLEILTEVNVHGTGGRSGVVLQGLANDDIRFIGVVENGSVSRLQTPLLSNPDYSTTIPYIISWGTGVSSWAADKTDRRLLNYNPNIKFGQIHLDFSLRSNAQPNMVIARLPADAPTPKALMETRGYNQNETIWLEVGDREIRCNGLRAGIRYIIDLTGFFN